MLEPNEIYHQLGGFGRFQMAVFAVLSWYSLTTGLLLFASVFLSYLPEFTCADNFFGNSTEDLRRTNGTNECYTTWTNSTSNETSVKCKEFEFDESLFTETTVTQFETVCEKAFLNYLESSVFMSGLFVGAILLGYLSDRYGRRRCFQICGTMMLVCMLVNAFATTFSFYVAARFLTGVFMLGCNVSLFVYSLEFVPLSWRAFVGIGCEVAFCVGYMLWSLIAYQWRSWKHMQIAAFIISLPQLLGFFFLPESFRWLISVNRKQEAIEVLRFVARINKRKLPSSLESSLECFKEEKTEEASDKWLVFNLFSCRQIPLLTVTIRLILAWCVTSLVYYGLSLNTAELYGNLLVNNVLNGLLESAIYIICTATLDRVGRRMWVAGSMVVAGISMITCIITKHHQLKIATTTMAFIGRTSISASFAVLYNYTVELYPTLLRSAGFAVCNCMARVASVLAPMVNYLELVSPWLPSAVFGVSSITVGLLTFTLPDTNGKEMLDTIEDANKYYRRRK